MHLVYLHNCTLSTHEKDIDSHLLFTCFLDESGYLHERPRRTGGGYKNNA